MIAFCYHLSKSLETLYELKEYQDSFEIETLIINNAKCQLLQNNSIEEFIINGVDVYVSETIDGYRFEYLDYIFDIKVNKNTIVDYFVIKN